MFVRKASSIKEADRPIPEPEQLDLFAIENRFNNYFADVVPKFAATMHQHYQGEIKRLKDIALEQRKQINALETKRGEVVSVFPDINIIRQDLVDSERKRKADFMASPRRSILAKKKEKKEAPKFEFSFTEETNIEEKQGPDPIFESMVKKSGKITSSSRFYSLNLRTGALTYFEKEAHKKNPEKALGVIMCYDIASCVVTGSNKDQFVLTMKASTSKKYEQSAAPPLVELWKKHILKCMEIPPPTPSPTAGAPTSCELALKDTKVLERVFSFLYDSETFRIPCKAVCKNWNTMGKALDAFYAANGTSSSIEHVEDEVGEESSVSPVFVLDYGHQFIKCGLTIENGTALYAPSLVQEVLGEQLKNVDFSLPRDSNPDDWEKVYQIWLSLYQELKLDPTAQPLIVTIDPSAPATTRNQMLKIAFERLNVPSCLVENSASASAYSYGAPSGLMVDMGFTSLRLVPIYCGSVLQPQVQEIGYLGARNMHFELTKLLRQDHKRVFDKVSLEATEACVNDILLKRGPMSVTLASGATSVNQFMCTLTPIHEQPIKFDASAQLARVQQLYLDPKVVYVDRIGDFPPLGQVIADVIASCDMDTRSELYSHILLCGGGALTEGLPSALEDQIRKFAPHAASSVSVSCDTGSCSTAAWVGSGILAGLEGFSEKVMVRYQYDEMRSA